MPRETLADRPLLAQNLRKARIASGFTQKQVAAGLNTTDVTVSNHERGETTPDEEQLEGYSELYGVPIGELRYSTNLGEAMLRARENAESVRQVGDPARASRELPIEVRTFLDRLRLRLTKGGATEEEVERSIRLLRSPDLFVWYSVGTPQALSSEKVLQTMKAVTDNVILPGLRERGRKV